MANETWPSDFGKTSESATASKTRGVLGRYLLAAMLARLADEGVRVAFLLLALKQTGNAALGGFLVAALLIPHIIAAPIVGTLASRSRNRKRFFCSALVIFGTALAICTALVGRVAEPIVLMVALLAGTTGPLLMGGMTGLLRDLLPADRIDEGYRWDVVSYNIAGIGGPALAAGIAGLAGAEIAALTLATFAGVAAIALGTLPLPNGPELSQDAQPGLWSAFRNGLGAFVRFPLLRAATTASCIAQIGAGATPIALALVANHFYSDTTTGLLIALMAAGGLMSSLVNARYPLAPNRPGLVIVISFAVTAVLFTVMTATQSYFEILIAVVISIGIAGVPQANALFTIRDREAPEDLRSLIFTTGGSLKITSAAVGALIAGVIADAGSTVILAMIATLYLAASGVGTVLIARQHAFQIE